MTTHPRIEAYLDTVTSSLAGDAELQRDIRAELAAHLDEAADGFLAEGRSPDESADLAIRTLGPATDYAGDLVAANRSRMRAGSRVRLLLRALVVPASVLTVAWLLWSDILMPVQLFGATVGPFGFGPIQSEPRWFRTRFEIRLSPAQRLILHGDTARHDPVGRERAIWEKWPTNIVYLNNYLSRAYASYDELGRTPGERLAVLNRELDTAIALDPDNARYHYLRADRLLASGGSVQATNLGQTAKGDSRYVFTLSVTNRAAIDQGMAELLIGLRKPHLRRYTSAMLAERISIMGTPRTLLDQVAIISVAAGVMLPDLSADRGLARASTAYGRLLIAEGRYEEARPFLDAWRTLTTQLADDSFTLVDVLVAGAIASMGENTVAPLYEQMGDPASADRTRRESSALAAPLAAFRERMKALNADHAYARTLRRKGGILAGLLLTALGEPVQEQAFAPGRLLEYTLLDQATCALAALMLALLMAGATLAALRWRFIRGAGGAPLLLVPDARQTFRILGYGVLLPLCAYYAWTRLLLPQGRDESLTVAWPVAVAQALLLIAAITCITVAGVARSVRKRCGVLGIEVPGQNRSGRWAAGLLAFAFLILAAITLAAVWHVEHADAESFHFYAWGLAAMGALLAGLTLAAGARYLFGSPRYGLYRGTLARTLIPHLALAVVLLTLSSLPYLRASEARLIATDPLMSMPAQGMPPGFTRVEAELTQRLRGGMLEAAARLGLAPVSGR